jgi:predicted protein tyrosine phosphatase
MKQEQEPAIVICSIHHLWEVIERADAVISVLGRSDKLLFPEVGNRTALRLEFDDTNHSSGTLVAPNRGQIAELVAFSRRWRASGTLVIHCKAGSSRSCAAAMIVAAALGRQDSAELALRIRTSKAYFRPNEAMLTLADCLLEPSPRLVELARSVPVPTRTDPWGPVWVPLTAPRSS